MTTPRFPGLFDPTAEIGTGAVVAGGLLIASGIALDSVTANGAPWVGPWLDEAFELERALGAAMLVLGVVAYLLVWLLDIEVEHGRGPSDDASRTVSDESIKASAQRRFNPPARPKPDWGETLRGLGAFVAVTTVLWYEAGAPPVGEHELSWLTKGVGAYDQTVLVLFFSVLFFIFLTPLFVHPATRTMLELPQRAAGWVLRNAALGLGALVFALITGAGLGIN